MKRTALLFGCLALCAGLYAQNTSTPDAGQTDTLRTSVVTGTRVSALRDQIPAPISVVGRETLETSDENVLMPSLMEQVPGLFITSRGVTGYSVSNGAAGAISLRGFGAGSGRVAILIDGHPQFESIYGHPVADEYLAGNAARVEVSRGAASVLYGSNAMGGAINIITRQPLQDGNELNVKLMGGSFGTFRGNVTDSYKQGRFTLVSTISADRTAGHRDNSAFNSIGGMINAGYQLTDVWKAKARVSFSDAYSQNPGPVSAPMLDGTANTIRGMAGVALENHGHCSSGAIDLFYNWGNHIINDGHTADKPAQEYLFHGTDFTAGLTAYQTSRSLTPIVAQIENNIIANYADSSYELDTYMHSLPFSYDYLRKMFQKELGITPHRYLMDKRLKMAAELLVTDDAGARTVGDIALLCGFHDPLYFSRMFKAKYGTAPRNYLESRLKQPIVRPDENSVRVQL